MQSVLDGQHKNQRTDSGTLSVKCNNRQQQKKQKWETSHRKCTFNLEECEKFRKKKETIDGLNKDGG